MYKNLSQKKLKEYTKSVIEKIGNTKSLIKYHPEYYYFFLFLFERHPRQDKFFNFDDIMINNKKVYLLKGNEKDEVSVLNKCITGRLGDELGKAMRKSIIGQIQSYKNKHPVKICEICYSEENIEVDHVILFSVLKNKFMINREKPIIGKDSMILDNNFDKEWKEYHRKNSILRYLCRDCNLNNI